MAAVSWLSRAAWACTTVPSGFSLAACAGSKHKSGHTPRANPAEIKPRFIVRIAGRNSTNPSCERRSMTVNRMNSGNYGRLSYPVAARRRPGGGGPARAVAPAESADGDERGNAFEDVARLDRLHLRERKGAN